MMDRRQLLRLLAAAGVGLGPATRALALWEASSVGICQLDPGFTTLARPRAFVDLLEEVGFERESAVTYKPAGSLPHGYLKRLELAKCLALRADLIILDELFSGLSIAELASIVPIIEKLMIEGKTVVMIEHRLRELFRIADRVLVLNFGRVIADGKPADVMDLPEVKQAYLGTED